MVNGKTSVKARIFAYLGVALVLTFGLLAFHGSGWKGSVQLHTIMEIVATLLAAMIGVVSVILGLLGSLQWDIPAGPAIVVVTALIFAVIMVWPRWQIS